VARILSGVIQQMFEADQTMVFLIERGGKSLSLATGSGIPENLRTGLRVKVGEGRIGWVCEHQVAMTSEDFQAQSRVGQLPITGDPAGMKVDLAAPIVHKDRVQGALAVGGIGLHSKGEKAMIKMAADLGSIALHNAALFAQLEQAANHDGLTRLANKQFFMQQIGIQINEAEKASRPLAVFIFDIDHFKSYNDQNGHLAGDEVLKRLSRLLRETLREDDLAARYGGEEFIVALPDTDREGAMVVAETLRRTVEDHHFSNQSNQPSGNLTISGGLAMFPVDGRTSTELIGNADRALYMAKAQGRNQVVLFKAPEFGDKQIDDLFEGYGG
jgi:diguanylate cyclase (GGDEF)-like protein